MKILIDQRVQENFYICNNNFVLSQYHLHLIHWHGLNCFCSFSGFPLQKGRHKFRNVPSWAENQCESITFAPFIFYPHKKIYVQLTVNHFNYSETPSCTRPLHPGLRVLTPRSSQPVSLELVEMIIPLIALPALIGSHIRVLPLGVWLAKKSSPDGGLELVVKQLPFQAYVKCCTDGL